MTPKVFDQIMKERLQAIVRVLGSKAGEYASKGDRLHNFKVAARIDNETPAKALWGMAKKHLVSIMDMVDGKPADIPMINEKIGDMINYLILLEAVLKEEFMNELNLGSLSPDCPSELAPDKPHCTR